MSGFGLRAERCPEAIVDLLVEAVAEMEPGTPLTTKDLLAGLPGASHLEDLDLLFEVDCLLREACLERGLLLDTLHHAGMAEGLPFNLDSIARRVVNRKIGPVPFDDVEGVALSWGGYSQGWRHATVLREEDGKLVRIADWNNLDETPWALVMPRRNLLGPEVRRLAEALGKCRIHRWLEGYDNPNVLDEEQWEVQVNLKGGRAIISAGSNSYPRYFRSLQRIMARIDRM